MRDHVLSASGKYQEVLVRNLSASTDRFLFASASYVATPPPLIDSHLNFIKHAAISPIPYNTESLCRICLSFRLYVLPLKHDSLVQQPTV